MHRATSPTSSAVRLRCALVGLCLVSIYACGESPSAPSGNASELAITGTDPAPDAPGIFLGTERTPKGSAYSSILSFFGF
jgi:hypothetical protein